MKFHFQFGMWHFRSFKLCTPNSPYILDTWRYLFDSFENRKVSICCPKFFEKLPLFDHNYDGSIVYLPENLGFQNFFFVYEIIKLLKNFGSLCQVLVNAKRKILSLFRFCTLSIEFLKCFWNSEIVRFVDTCWQLLLKYPVYHSPKWGARVLPFLIKQDSCWDFYAHEIKFPTLLSFMFSGREIVFSRVFLWKVSDYYSG